MSELPECSECGEKTRVGHDGSCRNCGEEAFPPLSAYENSFGDNVLTADELRNLIWRADWAEIFQNAVEGRPSSWGFFDRPAKPDEHEYPVAEWRNAMDELKTAFYKHFEDKGFLPNYTHRFKKQDYIDKDMDDLYVLVACPECGRAKYLVVSDYREREKTSMFCWFCEEVHSFKWRRYVIEK